MIKTIAVGLFFFLTLTMTLPSYAGGLNVNLGVNLPLFRGGNISLGTNLQHRHRGHRHHSRRDSRRAGYLVGGLVVGSLLTQAYNRQTYQRPPRQVLYNSRYTRPQPNKVVYLRDQFGSCYIVTRQNGMKVKTRTDWAACR